MSEDYRVERMVGRAFQRSETGLSSGCKRNRDRARIARTTHTGRRGATHTGRRDTTYKEEHGAHREEERGAHREEEPDAHREEHNV